MNKKLSIIIPVYNEAATVGSVLERVDAALVLGLRKEIIVVDDGSVDGTDKILEENKEKFNFIYEKHPKNMGKGAAFRTGLELATGDFIIVQDADLEYNPNNFQDLLNALEEGVAAVYGSRNINPKRRGYAHFVWGVKFLTGVINLLFGSKLTDSYTCYKLFRASLFNSIALESHGFEIEAEITAKILKKGLVIKEVPIEYFPRKFSQGKKIRFRDGLIGLWTIFKYRV
ncbi:MAG: glycosyltransferase family 2 protein [Candidatus Portnoybacteria bacterium]|nr:glycosyltransferase family 2 protein [Candidatus Portnoybacteria bacterium]